MSIIQIEKQDIFCSVVMPVHNGERFLREAIESVLNQTYTNFEFLIIENCSRDSSVEIIQSYNDKRIKLIFEDDCGQVQAYNRGFKESKGEYIFIHDHDDVSQKNRFEEQLKCMLSNNIDICGTFFQKITTNGNIITNVFLPIDHQHISEEIFYKNWTIFNSTVCFKRYILIEIGGFEKDCFPSADYNFYLSGIDKYKYGNVPLFLYKWRRHKTQISTSKEKMAKKMSLIVSLKHITKKRDKQKYLFKGLAHYYNNLILKSIFFLFLANFPRKNRIAVRYLILGIFGGIPLKVFRAINILDSKLFFSFKTNFDKLYEFIAKDKN